VHTGGKTFLTNNIVGTFCVEAKWWREVNVLVQFTLEQAIKAQKGVEKYLYYFVDLGAR